VLARIARCAPGAGAAESHRHAPREVPMSPQVVHEEASTEPGLAAVDLADTWLVHAATELIAACRLPETSLTALAADDLRPSDVLAYPLTAPAPACAGLAVLLAAAAVEARLNRTLRLSDPDDWHSVAHLVPEEKLDLTPRLIGKPLSLPAQHHELTRLAEELFAARAALVESEEPTAPTVARARELVTAAARICGYLSTLGQRPADATTASLVEHVAEKLSSRAWNLSASPSGPKPAWSWARDVDFPPDLVGS
jgi:hypothetical protein